VLIIPPRVNTWDIDPETILTTVIGIETGTEGIVQTVMTGTATTAIGTTATAPRGIATTDVTETEIIAPTGTKIVMSMDVIASAVVLEVREDEALTDAADEVILEALHEAHKVLPPKENTMVVLPLLKTGQGPLMVNRQSSGNDLGYSYWRAVVEGPLALLDKLNMIDVLTVIALSKRKE